MASGSAIGFQHSPLAFDLEDVALDGTDQARRRLDELKPGAQAGTAATVVLFEQVAHAQSHLDRAEIRHGQLAVDYLSRFERAAFLEQKTDSFRTQIEHTDLDRGRLALFVLQKKLAPDRARHRHRQAKRFAALQAEHHLGQIAAQGLETVMRKTLGRIGAELHPDAVQSSCAHELLGPFHALHDFLVAAGVENHALAIHGEIEDGSDEGQRASVDVGGQHETLVGDAPQQVADFLLVADLEAGQGIRIQKLISCRRRRCLGHAVGNVA